MNFDYNEEQQLLADSVRRFLAKDYGFERRRAIVASAEGWSAEVWAQLAGVLFTIAWSGIGTFVILKLVDVTLGLRVSKEQESEGLDLSLHDERAYNA